MSKSHILKTDHVAFEAVWRGEKLFEFRKNDREFMKDDDLTLDEITSVNSLRTGRQIFCRVSYILRGPDFGVPLGYCVMSIDPKSVRTRIVRFTDHYTVPETSLRS